MNKDEPRISWFKERENTCYGGEHLSPCFWQWTAQIGGQKCCVKPGPVRQFYVRLKGGGTKLLMGPALYCLSLSTQLLGACHSKHSPNTYTPHRDTRIWLHKSRKLSPINSHSKSYGCTDTRESVYTMKQLLVRWLNASTQGQSTFLLAFLIRDRVTLCSLLLFPYSCNNIYNRF